MHEFAHGTVTVTQGSTKVRLNALHYSVNRHFHFFFIMVILGSLYSTISKVEIKGF